MKYKIGIFSSAATESELVLEQARRLGEACSRYDNIILVSGAGTGIPSVVLSTAFQRRPLEIWGFSPCRTREEQQRETPGDDLSMFAQLFYIPHDFPFAENKLVCYKYRNVLSTACCDAGIFLAGKWGTLNEFTNLFDMGRVAGVLTGTGGSADELPRLYANLNYNRAHGKVLFSADAEQLLEMVMQELESREPVITRCPPAAQRAR